MKTRTQFLLSMLSIAALVAISGCEAVGIKPMVGPDGLPRLGNGPFTDCNGAACTVSITVVNCDNVVDPGTLYVGYRGQVQLIWQLNTPGYTFDGPGIVFQGGPITVHGAAPRQVTAHDNNTGRAGPFKYKILLRETATNKPCHKDPEVVNG